MNLRKKAHKEAEVFTDSLNDIIFILLMFFLIVATLANPNVVKVGLPRGTKDTKAKQNIPGLDISALMTGYSLLTCISVIT